MNNNESFASQLMRLQDLLEQLLLADIDGKLSAIIGALSRLENKMSELDDRFTTLETGVTDIQGTEKSAATLLDGLSQMLKDALAAGGTSQAQLDRVQAVITTLDQTKADLAAAVARNAPPAAPLPPTLPGGAAAG